MSELLARFKHHVSSEATAEGLKIINYLAIIFFNVQRPHLSKSFSLSCFYTTVTVVTFVQKFKARLAVNFKSMCSREYEQFVDNNSIGIVVLGLCLPLLLV